MPSNNVSSQIWENIGSLTRSPFVKLVKESLFLAISRYCLQLFDHFLTRLIVFCTASANPAKSKLDVVARLRISTLSRISSLLARRCAVEGGVRGRGTNVEAVPEMVAEVLMAVIKR